MDGSMGSRVRSWLGVNIIGVSKTLQIDLERVKEKSERGLRGIERKKVPLGKRNRESVGELREWES